jgi:hypothetical protein
VDGGLECDCGGGRPLPLLQWVGGDYRHSAVAVEAMEMRAVVSVTAVSVGDGVE